MDIPPISAMELLFSLVYGTLGALLAGLFAFCTTMLNRAVRFCQLRILFNPIPYTVLGAFIFGFLGALFPPTLFWGENELQNIVDGGKTPLPHVAVPGILTLTSPSSSTYEWYWFLAITAAKIVTISVSLTTGFCGGIIFPLFFVGAAFAHVVIHFFSFASPSLCILALSGAVESAINRTPLSTAISLTILHRTKEFNSGTCLPVVVLSCYTSVVLTRKLHFIATQRHRLAYSVLEQVEEIRSKQKVGQQEALSVIDAQSVDQLIKPSHISYMVI